MKGHNFASSAVFYKKVYYSFDLLKKTFWNNLGTVVVGATLKFKKQGYLYNVCSTVKVKNVIKY